MSAILSFFNIFVSLCHKNRKFVAEALKNIYNEGFIKKYLDLLLKCNLKITSMHSSVFNAPEWHNAELKQRMTILSDVTYQLLPKNWEVGYLKIREIVHKLRADGVKDQNLEFIFLADIVAKGAQDDIVRAMPEIEFMTQFVSFEFAGRALILKHTDIMMTQMLKWAEHQNENVRRYASEGCRPRLPWGLQLKSFVQDPSPIIPILQKLKEDDSLYVRKSVANNLNDIAKSQPDVVIKLCKDWKGNNSHTNWIVKHGLRSLLKQGHPEALTIIGLDAQVKYELSKIQLDKSFLTLNEALTFTFNITNKSDKATDFRLEYFIYFKKSNQQNNKKIFKISDKTLNSNETLSVTKKHVFRDMTTRRHYEGEHHISIVVNGHESDKISFTLKK